MNKFSLLILIQSISLCSLAQPDELEKNFITPPEEAKPRTWWHWTGSNITKEGITKDLEWMKRVGIGGFQAFDVSFGMGQTVDKKIVFLTPEWLDAIRHTAEEAERLGLEMTMVTSAGWSETGGPWVKPEEAIKKVAWSELPLKGGKKVSIKLPMPPTVNGPIRNLTRPAGFLQGSTSSDPTFYSDVTVLAYRTPTDEIKITDLAPKVISSGGDLDATVLFDDDLSTKVSLPMPTSEKPVWIQMEFAKPFTVRSFSLALALTSGFGSKDMCTGSVQASDDGKNFRTIVSLPGPQHDIRALPVRTYSFPEVTGRYFRIVFTGGSGITTVGGFGSPGFFGPPPTNLQVTEAIFYSASRVNRWEDKAHFAPMFDLESLATQPVSSTSAIQPADVVNISAFMAKDGTLSWDAPAGNWTIMRMGYSLTGSKNSPAVPAGTGFEVDKLSRKHLQSYYSNYTNPIAQALGPLYGKRMQYWLTDSFEADAQNWTEDMPQEFLKRRGYDMTPYLPVLSGKIVKSAEVSDRFLWDFRRTIADLLADNHYGALAEMAHQQGIKLYGESAGISLPIMEDALLNKKFLDIPMGEFGFAQGLISGEGNNWMSPKDLENSHGYRGASDRLNAHQSDIREAASAAHIYGKKFVATESWTGGGYEAPASLKLSGDYWKTQGVNRFIFHTSTHQPLDTKPGNAMVGIHMHRNITWAEQAAPFITYLSRNSYLLQQGNFVADILYYLGESIPSAVPYWKKTKPEPPEGFDYDYINTDALLNNVTVRDGKVVLSSGMSYEVLVLPETNLMTPHVLNKIRQLIADGATVVGQKPTQSPSLAGYPAVDSEVSMTANEIWGDADGQLTFQHNFGKGKVYWNVPLIGVLSEKNILPDVNYTKPNTNTYLNWIHRRTIDADIYFISNLRKQNEDLKVQFRENGNAPELWHSDTGEIEQADYSVEGGVITVHMSLKPEESVFVVFRNKATAPSRNTPKQQSAILTTIIGPWSVNFPPNSGAPEKITLDKLISLTEHSDEGVKYFSGTATYSKEITAPKDWFKTSGRFILQLGNVKDIAEVTVNAKAKVILWKAPYEVDISKALVAGVNKIEIKVTNQWTNRIAGDAADPTKKILSGAGLSFGPPSTRLIESGLIGPVTISLVK